MIAKYRKLSTGQILWAAQWHKNGDHPKDYAGLPPLAKANNWEGVLVRYFRHPEISVDSLCEQCGKRYYDHGWIDAGDQRVCPGDWILTNEGDRSSPVKPAYFEAAFEPVP